MGYKDRYKTDNPVVHLSEQTDPIIAELDRYFAINLKEVGMEAYMAATSKLSPAARKVADDVGSVFLLTPLEQGARERATYIWQRTSGDLDPRPVGKLKDGREFLFPREVRTAREAAAVVLEHLAAVEGSPAQI